MDLPENLTVLGDHPLIQVRLTRLRDQSTTPEAFRAALHDIARLMTYSLTADLATIECTVTTPIEPCTGHELARPLVLIPILRAGLGLLNGFTEILSEASVGHVGLVRNEESHLPERYYGNFPPNLSEAEVIIVDPMLATGGSAIAAIAEAIAEGAAPDRIHFAALISAPEGIAALHKAYPQVPITTASLDRCLNEDAYIVPGLGDAGDRYFGTL